MKLITTLRIAALVAVVGGLGLLAPFGVVWLKAKAATVAAVPVAVPAVAPLPEPKPTLVMGRPVLLSVPSVGIELRVTDGAYNASNGSWTLSWDKAHYALPSTMPNNEQGNTLIYAHFKKGVFLNLRKVTPGAEAVITTDNGYRFVYKFIQAETINPADTSVFLYKGDSRLTLQTCSGVYMQNRQMYYFAFEKYEKI
jgi:LPXTG-site transpeptidase (sortase) family protein